MVYLVEIQSPRTASNSRGRGTERGYLPMHDQYTPDSLPPSSDTSPSKICNRCGAMKPLQLFCVYRRNSDGHDTQCKECARIVQQRFRATVAYRQKVLLQNGANPDKARAKSNRYYQKHQAKLRQEQRDLLGTPKNQARSLLHKAVRNGSVVKPTCCQHCNRETSPRYMNGHHRDYSKPLDVVWLCTTCHGKEHRAAMLCAEAAPSNLEGIS